MWDETSVYSIGSVFISTAPTSRPDIISSPESYDSKTFSIPSSLLLANPGIPSHGLLRISPLTPADIPDDTTTYTLFQIPVQYDLFDDMYMEYNLSDNIVQWFHKLFGFVSP